MCVQSFRDSLLKKTEMSHLPSLSEFLQQQPRGEQPSVAVLPFLNMEGRTRATKEYSKNNWRYEGTISWLKKCTDLTDAQEEMRTLNVTALITRLHKCFDDSESGYHNIIPSKMKDFGLAVEVDEKNPDQKVALPILVAVERPIPRVRDKLVEHRHYFIQHD